MPFRVAAHRWENVSLTLCEFFSPCTHFVLPSAVVMNRLYSSHPLEAVTLPTEVLSVAAAYLSGRRTAIAASSAAPASTSAARRTSSSSSLCPPASCFASSPTLQSSSQQYYAAPRIQRQIFPSSASARIQNPAWLEQYPAASSSAYSNRVYSVVEEYLYDALDRIPSGSPREAEGEGENIDPMNAKLGGRGGRRKHKVEGGRREGSLSVEEAE